MTPEEIAAKAAADAQAAAEKAAAKLAADAAAAKAITDKAAAEKLVADKAAADEAERLARSRMTDKEAELLKEVMQNKEKAKVAETARAELEAKLKAFEGIDPAKAKELLDIAAKADAAKVKAEEDRLAKAGEFDRLKAMMAEESAKLVKAADDRAKTTTSALDAATKTISDLTVGAAFTTSDFVAKELVLTPRVARQVYGDHFESENGEVVGYDKPRGAENRTKLVDASGNAVTFDVAIAKLVEAAPDKDQLLKSKLRVGAGSRTTGDTRVTTGSPSSQSHDQPYGRSAMEHALSKGALASKKTK